MLSGVVRRLGTALAAVLFSTIVIFVLLRALPGDVATTRLGTDATLAIGLIFLFAVQFKVLPAGGFPVSGWGSFTEALRSLILPTVALAAAQTAMLTRFARSSSLEFVASDAFRTARAVGRPRNDALLTAQRLVLSPVLTVASLQVATLITGAVVIESVFALPGLGSMLVRDIANRDYPKVQSVLFVVVLVVFALRTIVDLANDRLDPRRVA
ncbi:MAG: ABC transporter permease [Actinobacteria bacterium]|nr:ABC transporter permease [Actinomycetota bacterium]